MSVLPEQIEEGSWGDDLDPTKVFERLQMALVTRNQIVRACADGAFEDGMVGFVPHHTAEMECGKDTAAESAMRPDRPMLRIVSQGPPNSRAEM